MPTKKIVYDGRADMPGGTGYYFDRVPCNCKGQIPTHSATEPHLRTARVDMAAGSVHEFDTEEKGPCYCKGKIPGHDFFDHEGQSDKARYLEGYLARGEAHEVTEQT